MRHPSERERLFEALFRARGIGAAFLDPGGRLTRVNPFLCELLGQAESELVGRRIEEFSAIGADDEDWTFLHRLLRGESASIEAERFLIDREGRVVAAWMHFEAARDAEGGLTGIAIEVQDVSLHRRMEERFRVVFESASLGIAILDLEGHAVASNTALRRILGYAAEELATLTCAQLLHPDDAAEGARELGRLLAGARERLEAERRFWTHEGRFVWLRLNLSLVRSASGAPDFAVMVCEDVTDRRQAEETLRSRTLQLLRLVPAMANEAATVDEALQICVTRVCQEMGWPVGHGLLVDETGVLAATAAWHLEDPERYEPFREASMPMRIVTSEGVLGQTLERGTPAWLPEGAADRMPVRGEVATRVGLVAAMVFPILIGTEVVGVLEFFSDRPAPADPMIAEVIGQIGIELGHVIQRKRMEAKIAFHALHDSLTKLPNRTLLMDRLKHALARMERSGHPVALLFLDVDGFKEVNDALGHAAGDQLLTSIASRLSSVLRPEDTVARLGGDEFTVLCEGVIDTNEAKAIASRITRSMKGRFTLKGGERTVRMSIGIAIAERPDMNPEELIRNADAAMYLAKKKGGGRYVMFDAQLRAQVLGRPGRIRALRRAVEHDQLRLVYQPAIALHDDAICGIEALVRWQHPERGLVQPEDIISLAEGSGLILPLGEWVLEHACREAVRWREVSGRRVGLWVNFSSRQLQSGQPAATIASILDRTSLDANDLTLEITESVLLGDTASVVAELEAIRGLGVGLSIDDFGTGYSSLSYLRRFRIDNVKLDRSFVEDLARNAQAKAIASAIIDLSHALDLTVVAEGVERHEQLEVLRALGCDCAQGFYFARPQPAAEIERMLAAGRPVSRGKVSGGPSESSA